tara:strand:- start:63 stop:932 length:870 start_codon:yes stop_codon:yes gene_type:complete
LEGSLLEIIALIQQFASPVLDVVMSGVTRLGSEEAYITFLLVWYLGFNPATGRRIAVYFLGGAYLNQYLKILFDTARPFDIDQALLRLENVDRESLGSGFPSGHAQSAATFWGLASIYIQKRVFTVMAVVVVLAIAYSRMYLGLHLPVDVVGGLLIGLAVVSLGLGLDRICWYSSSWWGFALGLFLPFLAHLVFTTTDSHVILGGLAGFLTGPMLVKHQLPDSFWARIIVVGLGLVMVFGYLFGTSLLLSEVIKDDVLLGFIRYLILAYVGIVLVPLIGRIWGLSLRRL